MSKKTSLIFTWYIKCWLCLFYPFGGTTLSIKLQGSQKKEMLQMTFPPKVLGSQLLHLFAGCYNNIPVLYIFSYIRTTSSMKSKLFLGLSPLQSIKSIDFSGCIMPWPQQDVSRPKENGQSARYSANGKKS